MKAFRFKKHRMKNMKIHVIVQTDEENIIIPKGGTFDAEILPPLPQPKMPLKLVTRVTKPTYSGRLELSF